MLTYMGVPVLPDGLDNSDNADVRFYRFSLVSVGLAVGTESPQECSVEPVQSSLNSENCAFPPFLFMLSFKGFSSEYISNGHRFCPLN